MSETLDNTNRIAGEVREAPEQGNREQFELPLFGAICTAFSLKEQDARQYSPLTLA